MEASAEGGATAGGDILRGEPSKKKIMEESLADSWSFLDKELEEFKKICDELDNGELLVCLTFYLSPSSWFVHNGCKYAPRLPVPKPFWPT